MNNNKEIRYYVNILMGPQQALAKSVYFRNNLPSEIFLKWKWYFEYRHALLKVKNPRMFCVLESGPYYIVLNPNQYKTKIKNLIIAKKRKITELKCKIDHAKNNWDELFPIEENPLWSKVEDKLNRQIRELDELEEEYLKAESLHPLQGKLS